MFITNITMTRILLTSFLCCYLILNASAQDIVINLDLLRGNLNGGKALPAEENFSITGGIPEKLEMVKLTIYPSKKGPNSSINYFWTAPFGFKENDFQVLVSDPLRSNESYQLEFGFYQKAGSEQILEIRRLISQNIETYLSTITTITGGGIKFSESDEVILSNLNRIVEQGAYYFELPDGLPFPGFSDLTQTKLQQRKTLKIGKAKLNVVGIQENDNPKAAYALQYLEELNAIISSELDQYLSPNMLVRVDEQIFANYPTEKTINTIPINIGYGAISISKNLSQQEFVTGMYLGLSFPLANRTFSPILSNLSISTGMFLNGNIENSLGEGIVGPILDRPVYLGLGYNFFRFLRLNAGGTFLATENNAGQRVKAFEPFIGLSAEFNLWLGFGKKK